MRTPRVVVSLLVAGLAVAAPPAAAQQDATVTARNFTFAPTPVTVTVGETVRFTNVEGFHNVHFENEPALFEPQTPDGPAWQAGPTKTFSTPGTYQFYCDPHRSRNMTGTIVVTAARPGEPTPTPTPEPTPTPTPTPPAAPTPPASPTPPATPPAPTVPAITVRRLAIAGGSFCTRAGRRCRRPGVVLRVDLSAPAVVAGVLERRTGSRYRRSGAVAFGRVDAGPRTLRFTRTTSGRRLSPGAYRLRVTVDGAVTRTLRFSVR